MFSQAATEVWMAVPTEWHSQLHDGLVAVTGGVLRHTIGSNRGQIAAHLIPVGSAELIQSSLGSVAGLVSGSATPFVVVGLIAASFHSLNTKISVLGESMRRLESKTDDLRWASIVGAVDQLSRIEREGRTSSIWSDLSGVRKELSASAAYHSRRLTSNLDVLKVPYYSRFQLQMFKDLSREVVADLVSLSIARHSLGRALLMDGAFKSAHHEIVEAKKEIHNATTVIAPGLMYSAIKQHEGWLGSTEHSKLVEYVTRSLDVRGSIDTLETVTSEFSRPPAWYDSSLSQGIQSTWKAAGLSDDAQFLLNLTTEASAKEESYRCCMEQELTPNAYLQHIERQRLLTSLP